MHQWLFMILTGNFQHHTKAIRGSSIGLLIFFTAMSITISGVYALPPDKNFGGKCDNNVEKLTVSCCWTETDAEGIEIEYCQHCDVDTKTGDIVGCGEKHPIGKTDYCSTRPQLCPQGGLPILEQDPPLTRDSPLTTFPDVNDLEEIQPADTDLSSKVGDKGSEQFMNEQSNDDNNQADLTSQDNNANTEQTDESQDQSAQN